MTSIRFHLRPPRGDDRHKARMFIRIIHKRKYRDIGLDYTLQPHEWAGKRQAVIPGESDPERKAELADIRRRMRSDREKLERIVASLSRSGDYTVNDIVREFTLSAACDTLGSYAARLARELTASNRPRTARAYRTAAHSIKAYNGGTDIPLSAIDDQLIISYEEHLLGRGLKMNTISFYMRNLRAIYYRAVKAKIIDGRQGNPFANVFTGVHETRRRSLDREDMNALSALEDKLYRAIRKPAGKVHDIALPSDTDAAMLNDALLYFMFSFHSRGMSFIDLAHLKKSDITEDTILYKRRKTGFYMEVKITVPMKKIIDHFSSRTLGSEYVFPVINSRRRDHRLQYETGLTAQNKRLKVIGKMAGIEKNLSTHVARHTWATLAKRMGYDVSLISEGLGHRDTKVTSIYLASFERRVLDEMSVRLSGAV